MEETMHQEARQAPLLQRAGTVNKDDVGESVARRAPIHTVKTYRARRRSLLQQRRGEDHAHPPHAHPRIFEPYHKHEREWTLGEQDSPGSDKYWGQSTACLAYGG